MYFFPRMVREGGIKMNKNSRLYNKKGGGGMVPLSSDVRGNWVPFATRDIRRSADLICNVVGGRDCPTLHYVHYTTQPGPIFRPQNGVIQVPNELKKRRRRRKGLGCIVCNACTSEESLMECSTGIFF